MKWVSSPQSRSPATWTASAIAARDFVAPQGALRLSNTTLIEDSGIPDPVSPNAREHPVGELPNDVLIYLLNSRYCEVDRLSNIATELFGATPPGWGRVQAVCDWVNTRVMFGYQHARPFRTALDVFTDRVGVCRDYQHLAIAFCRALNIPARYATGYLGDIGVPLTPPMDFSAWFEVYLDDQWWIFDARNNTPRIGRVLIATGRDASDVAITTSFGAANLTRFAVVAEEVADPGLADSLKTATGKASNRQSLTFPANNSCYTGRITEPIL